MSTHGEKSWKQNLSGEKAMLASATPEHSINNSQTAKLNIWLLTISCVCKCMMEVYILKKSYISLLFALYLINFMSNSK